MIVLLEYLIALFLVILILLVIWCLIKERQIRFNSAIQEILSLEKIVQDLSLHRESLGINASITFDEITEYLYRLNNQIAELKQSAPYTRYLCEMQKIDFVKSCVSVLVFLIAILFITLIFYLNRIPI
jgi:hypothetical protein